MLSKTAKYALRAVVYLAEHSEPEGRRVQIPELATALDVPRNYLSKVMHQLARAGILHSVRGPAGGFTLAVPPDALALATVTGAFDSTGGPLPCLLVDRPCDPERPCVAHHRWKELATELRDFFERTTVTELLRGAAAEAADG